MIKPRSPTLQVDSLPTEPQVKPKNTGVDTLSLLQWIFPTWELNQGLLYYGQILYQLSYQGSPNRTQGVLEPERGVTCGHGWVHLTETQHETRKGQERKKKKKGKLECSQW